MERVLVYILWRTYSALCISADRLTICSDSNEVSLVAEESLRDRGLTIWALHDSLSNSRSLASSLSSFSFSCAVRLFFRVSSY